MNCDRFELAPDRLRRSCEASHFSFRSTEDIPPLRSLVEQERPVRAIRFGLEIESPGYNIYVSGLTGTGKTTVIKKFLDEIAATMPTPEDWCYVYNFRDPNCPTVFSLPAGTGRRLREEMDELVAHLKVEFPKAFESKEYEQSMNLLVQENQATQHALFEALQSKAREAGFALEVTKVGVSLVPLLGGKPASPEEFDLLDDETKKSFERSRGELQQEINTFLRQVREVNKASRDRVAELNRRVGLYVVGQRIVELREQWNGTTNVVSYLADVQDYILSHMDDFTEEGQKQEQAAPSGPIKIEAPSDPFLKYKVNVVVDNTDGKGAPVIIETNPTYYNLFGRMERRAQFGMLTTDFTMIRAGSLLRANGGFLVVNASDVLGNAGSWDTMKRVIKNAETRIEDLGEQYGLVPVAGMRPSPIPIRTKFIMIGNQYLYHLLHGLDEEFRKLFKVKADFDSEMGRDDSALQNYAAFVSTRCHDEGLLHFDSSGVARVVEYGSRLVDDQKKLSTRFSDVADIVREASHWARKEGARVVEGRHVQRAEEEKYFRSNLVEERIREMIVDGSLLVDVSGEAVGQVNGLAVLDLGDIRFGKPSRITVKTFLGKEGVLDIERESKMSGKIYDKGVLILGGYIGANYAQDEPLSMTASICFEQSYDGIDGDSASSTELYALLSSLAESPIRQGIAVTGSVNQHGQIQPIGGVNQKIEGFYDVCRVRGLTGDQGVMIPDQNSRNLMLRPDLVEAVAQGRFHIYAVSTLDEGLEILTGIPAGQRVDGAYPVGTIHHRVEQKLRELGSKKRKLESKDKDEDRTS